MQVIDSYDIYSNTSVEPAAHLAAPKGEKGGPHPISCPSELAEELADRAAGYTGPVRSATGKMLWAIQAWYMDVGDQTAADEILASHDGPGPYHAEAPAARMHRSGRVT